MTQALYRRWRPQDWQSVVGQDHVVQTLRNAVKGDRVAHAYLFAGPRGTGKTTTARLLAKAVNCTEPDLAKRPCGACQHCQALAAGSYIDLIEIDAASNTSVEDVRDLREKINFSPNEGRFKVYIVDEVHMLSTAAFNALLKTLEEPPGHAIFILATTEVHKVPATVLSRCQRHEFRRLPMATILDYLRPRVAEEGFKIDEPALELIARQATGSMRDAISLLDQLTSTGLQVDLAKAQAVLGTATDEAVIGLVEALTHHDAAGGLTLLNRAVDRGADPRQLARQIVDYLRSLLLIQVGNPDLVEAVASVRQQMEAQATALSQDRLMTAIDHFSQAALEGRAAWQPKLPLELALVSTLSQVEPAVVEKQASTEAASGNPRPGATTDTTQPTVVKESGPAPAPAAPSDPPAAIEARPIEGEMRFSQVIERWPAILAAAKRRDPRCQALLNSGRPLGLDQGRLVIGFASDILREKMDKSGNRQTVEESLAEALGQAIGLRCMLMSNWDSEASDDPPQVEDGGMVATAIRDLGATVSAIQPVDREADKDEPE